MRMEELLFCDGIRLGDFLRDDRGVVAACKRIFRSWKKQDNVLEILSVHGSESFNGCLREFSPDAVRFKAIQRGLRGFRSKPCFDMVFYSIPRCQDVRNPIFLEELCLGRMLLKPGASLFLVADGDSSGTRSMRELWLRDAGFANIETRKMGNGSVLVEGKRPLQVF